MTARRRLRLRETTVICECGTAKRIRWWPLTYVRLTRDQDLRAGIFEEECKNPECGRWIRVTVGDAGRAA